MKNERRIQIGVMGSCVDLDYSKKTEEAAEELGRLIGENLDAVLFFGAEKDMSSLSQAACRGARRAGGLAVGVTYGKTFDVMENADIVIPTGLDRGGGREFVLALSCDVIISISGGSGTLNELAVAYQAGIPMVGLTGFGGWTDKMVKERYFDGRKRMPIVEAKTPAEAVATAINLAKNRRG
ncbi:MAG TPA: hypothetical protein VLB73_04125 [Patescibacteria group bacterium]|nr:hypothetical protein [Patescibacteria group bacterium]